MRVLCLNSGVGSGEVISGGDRHSLETWALWGKGGDEVVVFGTVSLARVLRKFGYAIPIRLTGSDEMPIGTHRLGYIRRAFASLRALWLARNERYDVVYASSAYFYDMIPLLFARMLFPETVSIFPVFHIIPLPWKRSGRFLNNAFAWLEQRLMLVLGRGASVVIVDNESLVNVLIRRGYRREQVLLSDMGFHSHEGEAISRPEFEAVYVGRFSHPKGTPRLLEAWARVVTSHPSAILELIGGEQDGFNIGKLVEEYSLGRNVRVLTGLTDEQVRERVARARVFVTASLEEGYGVSVLEALGLGVPCVTFDLEAFSHVFPKGRFAATESTADGLADALRILLADDALRARLGKEGKESVSGRTWERVSEKILARVKSVTR